jgi:hypothetical protein
MALYLRYEKNRNLRQIDQSKFDGMVYIETQNVGADSTTGNKWRNRGCHPHLFLAIAFLYLNLVCFDLNQA